MNEVIELNGLDELKEYLQTCPDDVLVVITLDDGGAEDDK